MPENSPRTSTMNAKRSDLLDWVRTAAIALVLLRHGYVSQLEFSSPTTAWPALMGNLAGNGWLGVDLFFVLSGFLLSRQLLRKDRASIGEFVGDFWRRRAYRILPTYLAVLIPIWLVLEYAGDGIGGPGHLQLLVHLLFLQDYFGSDLLVTTWSLATEEKFYLLLPLLVILSFRTSPKRFAGMLVVVSFLILTGRLVTSSAVAPADYSDFFWQVRAPFHNALDGLLLGMAAGYLIQANPRWLDSLPKLACRGLLWTLSLFLAVLLLSFDWLDVGYLLSSTVIWFVASTTACLLLVGVSLESKGEPAVRPWSVASWIAKISYPLYLIHYVMLVPAQSLAQAIGHGVPGRQFFFWFIYLTSSFLTAWLLHVMLEKPFLSLRESRKPMLERANPTPL